MEENSSKVASVSSPLPEDDTDDNVGSPLPADVNVATFECRGVVSDDDETECRICRGGAEMGPLVCPLSVSCLPTGVCPAPMSVHAKFYVCCKPTVCAARATKPNSRTACM